MGAAAWPSPSLGGPGRAGLESCQPSGACQGLCKAIAGVLKGYLRWLTASA